MTLSLKTVAESLLRRSICPEGGAFRHSREGLST